MRTNKTGLTRAELLERALDIATFYKEDLGLDITLRQLYYQFVSRGITGSGQDIYKAIGVAVAEARLQGAFPMDLLVDRGRDVSTIRCGRSVYVPDNALDVQSRLIERIAELPGKMVATDPWYGQPVHVSVWVEKEALAGVFEPTCNRLGVSFFACKGYPSVSSVWSWLQEVRGSSAGYGGSKADELIDLDPVTGGPYQNIAQHDVAYEGFYDLRERYEEACSDNLEDPQPSQAAVVLYFGDHDPDGLSIPEAAQSQIGQLQRNQLGVPIKVVFKRVALTREQISRYAPPPFDAKESSPRFKKYVDETGLYDAWELDALEPGVLQALIRASVTAHYDEATYKKRKDETTSQSQRLAMWLAGWDEYGAGGLSGAEALHDRLNSNGWDVRNLRDTDGW